MWGVECLVRIGLVMKSNVWFVELESLGVGSCGIGWLGFSDVIRDLGFF